MVCSKKTDAAVIVMVQNTCVSIDHALHSQLNFKVAYMDIYKVAPCGLNMNA